MIQQTPGLNFGVLSCVCNGSLQPVQCRLVSFALTICINVTEAQRLKNSTTEMAAEVATVPSQFNVVRQQGGTTRKGWNILSTFYVCELQLRYFKADVSIKEKQPKML